MFDGKWIREHLPENFWQRYKGVLRWAIPVTGVSILVALAMAGLYREAQNQKQLAEKRLAEVQQEKKNVLTQKEIADRQKEIADTKSAYVTR